MGKPPPELAEQPPLPEELAYLWGWFVEISSAGDFTWSNLKAWSDLNRVVLDRDETRLLSKLNALYLSAINGRRHHKASPSG